MPSSKWSHPCVLLFLFLSYVHQFTQVLHGVVTRSSPKNQHKLIGQSDKKHFSLYSFILWMKLICAVSAQRARTKISRETRKKFCYLSPIRSQLFPHRKMNEINFYFVFRIAQRLFYRLIFNTRENWEHPFNSIYTHVLHTSSFVWASGQMFWIFYFFSSLCYFEFARILDVMCVCACGMQLIKYAAKA